MSMKDNLELYEGAKVKADAIVDEVGKNIKKKAKKAKAEVGEDVKALKGRKQDVKKIRMFSGIRFKITISFIVPVVLMIGMGVFSYERSAKALTENYESASKSTLDTTADYMNLVLETIRTMSYDIAVSTTAREYYGGAYSSDPYKESTMYNTLKNELGSRKIGNAYLRTIVCRSRWNGSRWP